MIAFCTRILASPPIELQHAPAEATGAVSLSLSSFDDAERLTHWIELLTNQGQDVVLRKQGAFDRRPSGELWAFEVRDVALFWWTAGSAQISYQPATDCPQSRIAYWLLHLVLPLFLACADRFHFLHAGAVEIGQGAILFAADSMGGKSTLTDFFVRQGHALVADDKVASCETDREFVAVPSYPFQRPYRRAEDLGRFVSRFSPHPLPVRAVYELQRAQPGASIRIAELHGIDKFESLHYSRDLALSFLQESSFDFLARMAARVPVYRLTLPWDVARLHDVYDAVISHRAEVE